MKLRCPELYTPKQHPTRRGFKTKVDCYITQLYKFPDAPAVAHCVYELLYWGILEGDPEVRYLVPQSHRFYIGTSLYTSDLYCEKNGRRYIVEIKSEAGFAEFAEKSSWIREFLQPTPFEFVHVTNESIGERETFARNWLYISRTLVTSTTVVTERATEIVLDKLYESPQAIGDIMDLSGRVENCQLEIALFRLASIGKVLLDLDHSRINADTHVMLCR